MISGQWATARRRLAIAFFALICATSVWLAAAQDVAHPASPQQDLELLTVGNGKTASGHRTGFRIYAAPDGTKGRVVYGSFKSPEVAQQEVEEWSKLARTVTSEERSQSKDGRWISYRLVGVEELPGPKKKQFLIIKREELDCYLIESESLQVALQIDGLVGHE